MRPAPKGKVNFPQRLFERHKTTEGEDWRPYTLERVLEEGQPHDINPRLILTGRINGKGKRADSQYELDVVALKLLEGHYLAQDYDMRINPDRIITTVEDFREDPTRVHGQATTQYFVEKEDERKKRDSCLIEVVHLLPITTKGYHDDDCVRYAPSDFVQERVGLRFIAPGTRIRKTGEIRVHDASSKYFANNFYRAICARKAIINKEYKRKESPAHA